LITNYQFYKFKKDICYRYQCERRTKNRVCEARKASL